MPPREGWSDAHDECAQVGGLAGGNPLPNSLFLKTHLGIFRQLAQRPWRRTTELGNDLLGTHRIQQPLHFAWPLEARYPVQHRPSLLVTAVVAVWRVGK
ncbi:MAG: hypothetical protein ACPIOQ_72135, partial [Promethearchaeia archaeon]